MEQQNKKEWTETELLEKAEEWQSLLIGHANFEPLDFIYGAMKEVRDSLQVSNATEEVAKRNYELHEENIALESKHIEQQFLILDLKRQLRELRSGGDR